MSISMILKALVPVGLLLFSDKGFLLAKVNCGIQLVIFFLTSHLPCFFTSRMSYVDISWPWGLVFIGICPLLYADDLDARKLLISGAYIASGLRMGIGGILMAARGHLNQELPRYQYQRRRWAKRGVSEDNKFNFMFTMQCEIFVQCVANMGLLALPMIIQCSGYLNKPVTYWEAISWVLWMASIAWEHVADMQKLKFGKECKKQGLKKKVCNAGLWQYCRHPNYFGEWMVWNSLILTSIPSVMEMWNQESSLIVKIGLSLGIIQISKAMYNCLVFYTGAVPAEHYSSEKREGYKDYQNTVNMFFPWFPRTKQAKN